MGNRLVRRNRRYNVADRITREDPKVGAALRKSVFS